MPSLRSLWTPSKERVERCNLHSFIASLPNTGSQITDFDSLHAWSIQQPAQFWQEIWNYFKIIHSKSASAVMEQQHDLSATKWFVGAELNFAENLLRYRDNKTAIVFSNEFGQRRTLTYAELYSAVATFAAFLKSVGIGVGDRVAGFMPNLPETVIAMLATSSVGAIWSSCSPDFGSKAVLERFGQIEPKLLIAADGYRYNGKKFDCLARIKQLQSEIKSIKTVVVVPYLDEKLNKSALENAISYTDIPSATTLEFKQLPFSHPLYILYSSGTTGAPKCIVHSAGGTLLQHLKELSLHTDVKRSDKVFYFTTCGWMMWNWLVSSLALGATVVLYDGAPFHPEPKALLDLIDSEGISVFGTSAKYLQSLEKAGLEPLKTHKLNTLKTILSTGSPLLPESFDYVYNKVKTDVCLSSISGGTDIVSCFVLGCPTKEVYRGECQVRGLGLKVEVFDDSGKSLVGKPGELVCTAPFPALPLGFWNDTDGTKFQNSYFKKFPNVWHHGDWVELTKQGGMIIYGRSDAVLNPQGIRIGTAEIYSSVEKIPEIIESIVIGQSWQGDERIVLFVNLQKGFTLNQELKDKITKQISTDNSPRHVPAKIIAVPGIPRTISGKIVELAVKNIVHGREIKNSDALANPEVLEYFKNLPELQN